MDKTISLEFIYRSKTYYALIRTKITNHKRAYYITIMNGELERLLYGHHIVFDEGGVLTPTQDQLNHEIAELQQCVTQALCERLQLNSVA